MGIREFERRLTVALEAVLAAGMLGVFSTVVVLVTMRYVFQSGLVGANELATVAFIYLSSVGAAVAVGRDEHIRVDLLSGWLDARGKKALAVASLSLVALLNLVVVAYSVTWVATTGHTPMPSSRSASSSSAACFRLAASEVRGSGKRSNGVRAGGRRVHAACRNMPECWRRGRESRHWENLPRSGSVPRRERGYTRVGDGFSRDCAMAAGKADAVGPNPAGVPAASSPSTT